MFFTSKNAVSAFFSQHTTNNSKKYAALGNATAKALQEHVVHIHFIGEGNTVSVAQQYLQQLLPNEKVLFPISNVSLQTVQKSLPKSAVINVEAYATEEVPIEKIEADSYIFTSPSNVRSFLKHNTLTNAKKIIAIGNSTKEELTQHGFKNVVVAHSYSELGLLDGV